ncbi:MAG: TolC family protein, partial [Caulobacterales bacterium]|nr:TolC family protein [Caulobacterales bacterium]
AARVLEQLLGRPPVGLVEAAAFAPDVDFPPVAPPAQVLAARPDVRAAYERLESSVFQSRSAARAMLPDLTLGGSFARQTGEFANVSQWSAVAGLGQVVFDAGALIAQARAQGIAAEIQLETYRGAVLAAIEEVERGLSNEASLREQIEATRAALAAAQAALSDGEASYRSGLVDFRTLLSRRLQVSQVETALVRLRARRLSNRLSLALALGIGPQNPKEQTDG